MEDTRYAPPATADLLVQKDPSWVSGPLPPRPIAIWVLSIMLVLVCGLFLFGLMSTFMLMQKGGISPIRWLVQIVVVLLFAVAFGAAIRGMWRRRRWSRWMGLGLIALMALWSALAPDTTAYVNEAERNGGFIARGVMIPLLCLWWAYALGFSAKARRYFGLLKDQ